LIDLDEKHGVQVGPLEHSVPVSLTVHFGWIQFNILWIDPDDQDTIPTELRRILQDEGTPIANGRNHDAAEMLRAQMRADALEPLETTELEVGPKEGGSVGGLTFDPDTVEDTRDWLQLSARDRLGFTLGHLRERYWYCFWCGTSYEDASELSELCPGEDEDSHD